MREQAPDLCRGVGREPDGQAQRSYVQQWHTGVPYSPPLHPPCPAANHTAAGRKGFAAEVDQPREGGEGRSGEVW